MVVARDVFTMRADGSKPRNRTNYPLALNFFPDWQPRVNDHHGNSHGDDHERGDEATT